MPDVLRPWAIIMLAAGGLFTGGLVWYAWERVWIWRRLSLDQFAVDFRRSVRRADPAMPIFLVVCGAAAGAFASLVEGGARTLALLGVGFLGVILVSSILVAEPINSQFRRRAEGAVPPGAERLRSVWRRFHLVRTPARRCSPRLPHSGRHVRSAGSLNLRLGAANAEEDQQQFKVDEQPGRDPPGVCHLRDLRLVPTEEVAELEQL